MRHILYICLLSVFLSPSAFSGSWGCFIGAVSGSEVGGAVGSRWSGRTPRSTCSGGAGWCHEEVHLPSAETWEKDCGTSLKALQDSHSLVIDRGFCLGFPPSIKFILVVIERFIHFRVFLSYNHFSQLHFHSQAKKTCLSIDKLALWLLLSGTLRLEGTTSYISV